MKKTTALLALICFAISCKKSGNTNVHATAAKEIALNTDYKNGTLC